MQLYKALFEARVTPEQLAEKIGVDPKTVERWISTGRTPYPRHQHAVAVAVGVPEAQLWPDADMTVSEELRRAVEDGPAARRAVPSHSFTPPEGWQDDGAKPHEGWMFEYETLPDGRVIRGEVLIRTIRDAQSSSPSVSEPNSLATVHELPGIDRQPDADMRALMSWVPARSALADHRPGNALAGRTNDRGGVEMERPEMEWGGFDR
ncbi:hypothetical protein [Nocardia wallacei]|uniref:hypothetical protein n=1 Tax=Nocardia wallacei TaxID=480035 RepID=UPI00245890D7|nr:hypothetical protein [Nocardia wallacei]